jgi:tRNA U34 5-methylaminomethyl-2-thiouridine-forming methyltransferase MnmC
MTRAATTPPPASAYQLVRVAGGVWSVRALAEGETFHPVIGPAAEAEALYLRPLRLVERMRQHAGEFVIWDVGLGAAANVLTVLRAIRDLACPLRVVSFDHTLAALEFALGHGAALGYFAGYESVVERLLASRAVSFANGRQPVNWSAEVADFPSRLASDRAKELPAPHAILYDAFSPARNPDMWTLPLFRRLFGLLDPRRPCALATYSRATLLRVTLLVAGFYVGAGHATGEKEETTVAANDPALIAAPLDRRWLARARRSSSAEPLAAARYAQARLTAATLDRLERHPQFRGA